MIKKPLKSYSLEEMEDKYIGKRGTRARDEFEYKLSKDVLGHMIKKARQDRKLTQEQLGKRVGVQKAQISRLESGSNGVTINSILKIFRALKAEIHFHVTIEGRRLPLV